MSEEVTRAQVREEVLLALRDGGDEKSLREICALCFSRLGECEKVKYWVSQELHSLKGAGLVVRVRYATYKLRGL